MAISVAAILTLCYYLQRVQSSATGYANIAYRKPASQSTTEGGSMGKASNAVDGNTEGDLSEGSCSQTTEQTGIHWWMVDLQDIFSIRSFRITNRNDCCHKSTRNITIEISREDPSTLPGFPGKGTGQVCLSYERYLSLVPRFPFECDVPLTGRYVRIVSDRRQPTGRLTLCEVEVYEDQIIVKYPVPEGPNFALNKPASQITTNGDDIAAKAVDGSRDGYFDQNSCMSTLRVQRNNIWWMVDLKDSYKIVTIRITNRNDDRADRLENFYIEVSEEHPETLNGFPGRTNSPVCVEVKGQVPIPVPVNYECDEPVIGRYVRLVKSGKPLNMCEFEVYGDPPKISEKGKNGLWAFVYVKSHGFEHTHSSMLEQRYLTDCARQRLKDKENKMAALYIQIDLPGGTCRFLENKADSENSKSSKWTLYKMVRF